MLKKLLLNLQLFADGGGDGGDGGSASASVGEALGNEESGEKKIPASIPEKAKKYYQKAMEKHPGSTTEASRIRITLSLPMSKVQQKSFPIRT